MPIFKLFAAAEGEPSTSHEKPTSTSADLSFPPENELIELIWENGQVTMQGQSSRAKKNPSSCNTLPPCSLPLRSPKRGKDLSTAPQASSSVKFRTSNSSLNEFPMSVPLEEICMRNDDDDDDIVPWFDYLIDESLQNDYCSDFLPELSGITASEPSQKDFDTTKRGGCINHVHRDVIHDDLNVNHLNSSKSSSPAVVSEATRHGTNPSLAGLAQSPSLRPRYVSENTGTASNHIVSGNSSQVTSSAVGLSSEKLRKRNLGPSVNHDEFLNFSHFSRPAVLYKSTLGKNCAIDDSSTSSLGRDHFIQKDCSPDVKTVKSNSGPIREMRSHGHYAVQKEITYSGPLEATPNEELPSRESEEIGQEHAAKDDKQRNDGSGANTCEEPLDAIEPVVASSICSGNGIDSVSDELPINLKRKGRRNYDSEAPSDDVEDDSVGLGKSVPARCSSSKRCRSAEVHNLSERRRRDRINEKMRALQELIPNCNKVDKASMLDEAIDYLKTLQLQVQMMSMGAGLYVPPMMLPAHSPQFSPMSIGMAAGLGFGMGMVEPNGGPTACPMFWVPPMQGAHFPSPVMSGHQALHGMGGSSFPVMGFPSTMLPFSMPHVPLLVPSSGGTSLVTPALNANVVKGHVDNTDAAFASSPKEATENINGANCSMNNISSQYRARNGGFELPEDPNITTTTAPTEREKPA